MKITGFWDDKDGLTVSDAIALLMAVVAACLWLGVYSKFRGAGLEETDIEFARQVLMPLTLGLMGAVSALRALKLSVRLKRAAGKNGGNGDGNGDGAAPE